MNYTQVQNQYMKDVADFMYGYVDRVNGDLIDSILAIYSTYDREIRTLWDIGYSPEQTGVYLSSYLNFKPIVSSNYICTVPNNMKGWEKIFRIKRHGIDPDVIYNGINVRLRGRGNNRRERMSAVGRILNQTHDLPVSLSDSIAVYKR